MMDKNHATTTKAIFAGGCFWCMEPPFEKLDGVHAVVSGYIGGSKDNPTYQEQQQQAKASKNQLEKSGRFNRPIVTEIVAATTFYPAEGDHQGYDKESPIRYKLYRNNSGRDPFLDKTWSK